MGTEQPPHGRYFRTPLDERQLGHLQHFANLSRQLPNDWSHMQGKGVGQEDFGGYRFQLAFMAYALAITHVNRLPNAPGLFEPTFRRLIEKMLAPEVWTYWHDVSRGGSVYNQQLGPLDEQWDPVARDNIMYSAYLQSMTLLYNYLFGDDRYAAPNALSLEYWSFFWGGGARRFDYDQNSLNEAIYWQMVESGYLGVACEPNCIFQICNQPAILGFRMHDLVNGGHVAEDVTREYEHAWAGVGRLDDNGHYITLRAQDSGHMFTNDTLMPWVDAWLGTLMNMWNRDFVHEHYPHQIADVLIRGDGATLSVAATPPREIMGQRLTYDWGDFGWAATWASEMGDEDTLRGLLAHADTYMSPTWSAQGLHYPRQDEQHDDDGNLTLVDPITGNALLGYARLNVPDGLWHVYNTPWTDGHFAEPLVVRVDDDVQLSQAYMDDGALVVRARRHAQRAGEGHIAVANLRGRRWRLQIDGVQIATDETDGDGVRADGENVLVRIPSADWSVLTFALTS